MKNGSSIFLTTRLLLLSLSLAIATPALAASDVQICSFNIQFLGAFQSRDNDGLAELMKNEDCDIVVIQELVSPPSEKFLTRNNLYEFPRYLTKLYDLLTLSERNNLPALSELRMWPLPDSCAAHPSSRCLPKDRKPIRPSIQSDHFFTAMERVGFRDFVLSSEDTGAVTNHTNSTAAEWFVTFFNPKRVRLAPDLPHGFIHAKRVGPRDFDRTPYAFPFRTVNGNFDFVLISVHLAPTPVGRSRRLVEMKGISRWISRNRSVEKDYIILGDMNIENRAELDNVTSALDTYGKKSWKSLNESCQTTNTIARVESRKPYDHALIDRRYTTEAEIPTSIRKGTRMVPNFEVIDLKSKMAARWKRMHPGTPYPGALPGYNHDAFRTTYSDHNPVKIRILAPSRDDDAS